MSSGSLAVRVTAFGQGRCTVRLPAAEATVGLALQQAGVEHDDRRVALNGHPVDLGVGVADEDEVSVVPKVYRG